MGESKLNETISVSRSTRERILCNAEYHLVGSGDQGTRKWIIIFSVNNLPN